MCIWDSYVYQKGFLFFFLFIKVLSGRLKFTVFSVSMARFQYSLKFSFSSTLAGVYLQYGLLSSMNSAASASLLLLLLLLLLFIFFFFLLFHLYIIISSEVSCCDINKWLLFSSCGRVKIRSSNSVPPLHHLTLNFQFFGFWKMGSLYSLHRLKGWVSLMLYLLYFKYVWRGTCRDANMCI